MGHLNPSTTRPDRMVGRYRVYSELAAGGMATVHLGCLLGPGGFSKLVAIKRLHQEFAAEPEFVSMFLDEARLASTIHHPNVVASLDVVAEQGELLVVMEYVHGETLAGLLRLARQKSERVPLPVAVRVLCDALEGLHAAHTASLAGRCLDIVHRDVSPQNIMVGADGNSRVLDFGIAKAALRSQVTSAGTVRGKVAYMSPEQVQGQTLDARTDVFAAGVVLWEALTGRRLFYSSDAQEAVAMLLKRPIPAPSAFNAAVGPELDRVVQKALHRDLRERYQTAHDFVEGLRKASIEGSRSEVAAWVNRLAAESLAERQELLHELESSAIHERPVSLLATPGAGLHLVPAHQRDSVQTQATTVTSVMPQGQTSSTSRRAPWAFAALGLLSALGVWLLVPSMGGVRQHGNERVATTRGAHHVGSAAAEPQVVASASSPTAAAGSPDSNLPVVAADSMPLAPDPTTSVKLAPRRPPSGSAGSARATGTRSGSCSPPYRIDASGVRRVKPECL